MFKNSLFNWMPLTRLMKNGGIVFIFIAIGMMALWGCSVKEKLYGVINTDNSIQTDADVPLIVNGVYSIYQGYGLYKSSAHGMILYSADEFCTLSAGGQGATILHNETAGDIYVQSSWQTFFSVIEQANNVIAAINNAPLVTAATRTRAIGEMYFMRGFTYFNLVRLFGGVPVRLSPMLSPKDFYQKRQSVDSVYHQIFIDLGNANTMCIPYSLQPQTELGRATKGAAQAMLSLAYLTYGNYLDLNNRTGESSQYYSLANSYADSVINSKQYRLLNNYASLFDVTNERNSYNEVIFGIQQTRDATIAGAGSKGSLLAYQMSCGSLPHICGNLPYGYGQGTIRVQPWFYNLYSSGDYRDTVKKINDYRTDFTFLTNWYKNDGVNPVTHIITYPVVVPDSSSLSREQLPYFNKYNDPLGFDSNNNENDEYIIRLAEIYLIKAEALNELGQSGAALAAFNVVRARARLGNGNSRNAPYNLQSGLSQYDFRMAVYNERGIELTGEFSRWFDDVRIQYQQTGKCMLQWRYDTYYPSLSSSQMVLPQWNTTTHQWNSLVRGVAQGGVVEPITVPLIWLDKFKLFPIPASELAGNANFGGQNPGW